MMFLRVIPAVIHAGSLVLRFLAVGSFLQLNRVKMWLRNESAVDLTPQVPLHYPPLLEASSRRWIRSMAARFLLPSGLRTHW